MAMHRHSKQLRRPESLESRLLLTGAECAPVVQIDGNVATVIGQAMDDQVQLTLGTTTHVLDFSGFQYNFAATVTEFHIAGGFGDNTIEVVGSSLNETADLIGERGTIVSSAYRVETYQFESTSVVGGGGNDTAELYGSNLVDAAEAFPEQATLTTPNVTLRATGYDQVDMYGRGGEDIAQLYGTDEADWLGSVNNYVRLVTDSNTNRAIDFERVNAYGRGGQDTAALVDSASDDLFVSTSEYAWLRSPTKLAYTVGFEVVEARGVNGGTDAAYFFGNALTADSFMTAPGEAAFTNRVTYQHKALGFDSHTATANGPNDTATFFGWGTGYSADADGNSTSLTGPSRSDEAIGFSEVAIPSIPEFEGLLLSLEPYLPDEMIAGIAAQLYARPVINGTNGNDDLLGTAGNNEINARNGNDFIYALAGNDLARGENGSDSIHAMDGNDTAFGGNGNDEIKGGLGNDVLLGGAGGDIIDGEQGNDVVSGGTGNDLFRFISQDETVIISDFSITNDRIELINIVASQITLGQQYGSLTITHPNGLNIILLGVSPALTLADLTVDFVTDETQTLFDPNGTP